MDEKSQLLTEFEDKVNSCWVKTGDIPGILYHYTDSAGALGIIGNESIRLTHADYLNDTSEIEHGVKVIQNILHEELGQTSNTHESALLERVHGAFEAYGPHQQSGVYLCSFTTRKNDLSQWRAYGGGGAGVALGIKFDGRDVKMRDLDNKEADDLYGHLAKCEYSEEIAKQRAKTMLRGAASTYADFISNNASDLESGALEIATSFAMNAISTVAVTMKNENFVEEEEWRFYVIVMNGAQVNPEFRYNKYGLIPYIECKVLAKNLTILREVWIGPSADARRQKRAMEMLIKRHKRQCDVHLSEIPYLGN